jgi:hypothetical protein
MVKRKKIRWADSLFNECEHSWEAKEGETYSSDTGSYPATGMHHCIKQRGHVHDCTDDDHQCCCGNTTDE